MIPVSPSAQLAGTKRQERNWEETQEGEYFPQPQARRGEREGWSAFSVSRPSAGFLLSPSVAKSMKRQGERKHF